jgi:predicted metal-dependent peptidase
MDAMRKMIKARAALILDQRFFGALALKLKLQEDETAETMWTDGITIGFNPTWVNELTMDEVKGTICHEVMHCSLGHNIRRNGRDTEDWNIAADYAVDPIIINANMVLPQGGHISAELKDKSTEENYTLIHGKKKQENPNGCGEVRDLPGKDGNKPTEAEKQQHQQDWQIATAQAAKIAEGCGSLPGNVAELVKEMLEPKVPWTEVLQRFVEQVQHNDYTYARTNPRYAAMGMILPTLYNKELPPIDIWIDTSGSISNQDKKQFVGEINDIRSHYNTTIRVIFCDTDVRGTFEIKPENNFVELETKGGGGTRFSPAIAWSMKQEDLPICGIYLTDMDCEDFGKKPDFPVLWIQVKGKKKLPLFGELVHMNPKHY